MRFCLCFESELTQIGLPLTSDLLSELVLGCMQTYDRRGWNHAPTRDDRRGWKTAPTGGYNSFPQAGLSEGVFLQPVW